LAFGRKRVTFQEKKNGKGEGEQGSGSLESQWKGEVLKSTRNASVQGGERGAGGGASGGEGGGGGGEWCGKRGEQKK